MIIHTVGLEGSGHHGLEPVFRKCVGNSNKFYTRSTFQIICNSWCRHKSYDTLCENLITYFAENEDGIWYMDNSYPFGRFRKVGDQLQLSKLYDILKQFKDTRIIHLKRDMFNTVNSHPGLDGGIINHARVLHEINKFIESELSILRSNNVEIIELDYTEIPTEKGIKIISSLLTLDEDLVQKVINETFKLSTKDFKKQLTSEVINELELIFNEKV